MSKSAETSSNRHRLPHSYAEVGDAFPGSNLGHGGTAQQLLQPPHVVMLAQVEVGAPAVRRGDDKPKARAPQEGLPDAPERP